MFLVSEFELIYQFAQDSPFAFLVVLSYYQKLVLARQIWVTDSVTVPNKSIGQTVQTLAIFGKPEQNLPKLLVGLSRPNTRPMGTRTLVVVGFTVVPLTFNFNHY